MTQQKDALDDIVATGAESVEQLHQLHAHVLALGVCASLAPRDVFGSLALTSKRLHGIVQSYESALATIWLTSALTKPSPSRLSPVIKDTCNTKHLLHCLHGNMLTNGHMDAPFSSAGIPTTTVTLTGPLHHEPLATNNAATRTTLFGWKITSSGGSGWAWQPLHGAKRNPLRAPPRAPLDSPLTSWLHAQPDTGAHRDSPPLQNVLIEAGEIISSYQWCEMTQARRIIYDRRIHH